MPKQEKTSGQSQGTIKQTLMPQKGWALATTAIESAVRATRTTRRVFIKLLCVRK